MTMPESEVAHKISYTAFNKYLVIFGDMFKYGFVSSFALLVDAGLLILLVENYGIHYLTAASAAFYCGLVANYILAKIFVFKTSRLSYAHECFWYAVIGLIGLALNDLIIYILVWLQLWYLHAKAVSVAIVFFFNFFGRRRLFAD